MCSPRAKALTLEFKPPSTTKPQGTIVDSVGTLKEGYNSSKREAGGEKHLKIQVATEASQGHVTVTYTSSSSS